MSKKYLPIVILFSVAIFVIHTGPLVWADDAPAPTATTTADDLKSKIDERNKQIEDLQHEIDAYNITVDNVGKQAKTLQNTLTTLDLTKKKINTDINLTQNKIVKTQLTMQKLALDVASTSSHIDRNKQALARMLQDAQMMDGTTSFQLFLSRKNVSDIWNDLENVQNVKNMVANESGELSQLKLALLTQEQQTQSQKKQLTNLKTDLSGKKQAVESTVQEKTTLLAQTKNKEATFQQIIQQKLDQKAQFEQDVYNFESQLNITIDKNGYPAPQHGILSWPVDNVFITQKFGKTVGAERLYASGSHNGVDFRASVGTKVMAVLGGTVVGTGNTDIYPGCYSFGKWVMIKHDNGLSSIYGHLSVISMTKGQTVETGDTVGFSGNTGYSTGPHLHISLYATQGVRIEQYVNSHGCKQAVIPLADIKAYLDPLAYFPSL